MILLTREDITHTIVYDLSTSPEEMAERYAEFVRQEYASLKAASETLMILCLDGVTRPFSEVYPDAPA